MTDTDTVAYKDEETLRRLYVDEGLSQPQIAWQLDCSVKQVSYWMDKHGLLVGPHSEGYDE
jgi:DNA-binding transcriptional regulator YiaG